MVRLIYRDKLYICGKPAEVTQQLAGLLQRFTLVKDLLEYYTAGL